MDGQVLTIVAVVAVVAAITAARVLTHRRRVGELAVWAATKGWTYAAGDASAAHRFSGTPFESGDTSASSHVLTGPHRDTTVLAFQYQYTTRGDRGTDNSSGSSTFRITAVPVPGPTPVLQVAEEHLGHKILGAIGVHDLQLDDPAFDDAFRVQSQDDDFARAVLTPELTRWLVAEPRTAQFRFADGHLLSWENGAMDPEACLARADFLLDLLERVPARVWARPAR